MREEHKAPYVQDPSSWHKDVTSAVQWIVAQLHWAHLLLRERLLDSGLSHTRDMVAAMDEKLEARNQAEVCGLLQRRFGKLPARKRSHYDPADRIRIIHLMWRNGWAAKETSRRLLVSERCIRQWMRDYLDGTLRDASVVPHNKHDEIVVWLTHELKERYPAPECGHQTLAHVMVQNGIACAKTSVGRHLKKRKPKRPPAPNRAWHLDLTVLKVFCFHIWGAAIIDGYSRRIMAVNAYAFHPNTNAMIALLRNTVTMHGAPRFLVTDHGRVFWKRFKKAVEAQGSTLVKGRVHSAKFNGKIERWFKTLKLWQHMRLFTGTILRAQRRLDDFKDWYNGNHCHQALSGLTPMEAWHGLARSQPCPILARDPLKPAVRVHVDAFRGHARLPVVRIEVVRDAQRAA